MPCKKKAPRCAHDHLHPFLCLMREMPHLHGHGFVALVHGGREGALLVQLVAPLQAELLMVNGEWMNGEWMSDDFEFVGPEGGLLTKAEYLEAIGTVDLSQTDLKSW